MTICIKTVDGEKYRLGGEHTLESILKEVEQSDSTYVTVDVKNLNSTLKVNIFKEHIVSIFDLPRFEPSFGELG